MFAELQRQAVELRLAGATITEIIAATGRPKTTVWGWIRSLPLPLEQQKALRARSAVRGIAAQAHAAAQLRREKWICEAQAEWPRLKAEPFFLFGLGLYWGEGNKVAACLRLTNADGDLLRSWSKWCSHYFPGRGMTASAIIHEDTDRVAAQSFWEECLRLPIRIYSYPRHAKPKPFGKKLPHGTGCLAVKKSLDALIKTKEWCRLLAIDFG